MNEENVKLDLTEVCLNDNDKLNIDLQNDDLVDILMGSQPSYSCLQKEYTEDYNVVVKNFPVYSIIGTDSLDSEILKHYIERLPEIPFSAHVSVKIDGDFVRLIYKEGVLIKAFDKEDNNVSIDNFEKNIIDDINGLDYAEIRGIIADDNFIAYDFVGDGVEFETKQELYEYLEDLGFEVPLSWVIDDLTKVTLRVELDGIISDCETEITADETNQISGYPYATSGLVFTLNDYDKIREIGTYANKFDISAIVLRKKAELKQGIVQAIYWKQGFEVLKPYALIAEDVDVVDCDSCVMNLDDVENMEDLGVYTKTNLITEVPLYDASNLIKLDAYVGNEIYFIVRNNNVYPCYADGTIVVNRREFYEV